jgi:ABC-type nickel/cobalt efflux system permease component RcnA
MRVPRLLAVVLGAGAVWAAVPAGVAQAHPLGNFTVNHYDHLQLTPDEVRLTAVVDRAEIPTAQLLSTIAADHRAPTQAELGAASSGECADVAVAVRVAVDGHRLDWAVDDAALETVPGAAGLPTMRLTCDFSSAAALRGAARVDVDDSFLTDRVGWREMTADGEGVRLLDSPVPVASVSDELRRYPVDLLASPVDVRSFTVATRPGENTGAGASITPGSGDPLSNLIAGLDRRLEDVVGGRGLTPVVGALAVLLAVLLGAGHAVLPGHGKTVMAAYLAGRQGRSRDAIAVGATVTATHTLGVLGLGLAISLSSSLAGDQVIRWLGVVSGLLVAGIGVTMLRSVLFQLRGAGSRRAAVSAARPEPVLAGHAAPLTPPPPTTVHVHDHDHDHDHGRVHDRDRVHVHVHDHVHDHDHDHDGHGHVHVHVHDGHGHDDHDGHDHDDHDGHDHGHGHDHDHDGHGHDDHAHDGHDHAGHGDAGHRWVGGHTHGPGGHTHASVTGRRGLVGMGIAGGLVPSPSALIVLMASIGLGRTVFGVFLVLAYGLGMAGTLTAVGLLLVRVRGRWERRVAASAARWPTRVARLVPVVTAVLVIVVGVALVVRGAV